LSDNQARAEEFGGALTIARPAAVKTGTTNDYKDALTIGYTPSLVVGVWVGNNDNTPMDNIAGSLGAAPIWRNLMTNFLSGTPIESFIKPASIVSIPLCLTPGPISSTSAITEYFIKGTQPQGCSTPTPFPTNQPTDTPTPEPTGEPTNDPNKPTETPTPTPAGQNPTQTPTTTLTPTSPLPTITLPI
jgi:membrane carboxypeptidase/penicillin-binding protein PbpC